MRAMESSSGLLAIADERTNYTGNEKVLSATHMFVMLFALMLTAATWITPLLPPQSFDTSKEIAPLGWKE